VTLSDFENIEHHLHIYDYAVVNKNDDIPAQPGPPLAHGVPIGSLGGAEPRHADLASEGAESGRTRELFGVINNLTSFGL